MFWVSLLLKGLAHFSLCSNITFVLAFCLLEMLQMAFEN